MCVLTIDASSSRTDVSGIQVLRIDELLPDRRRPCAGAHDIILIRVYERFGKGEDLIRSRHFVRRTDCARCGSFVRATSV